MESKPVRISEELFNKMEDMKKVALKYAKLSGNDELEEAIDTMGAGAFTGWLMKFGARKIKRVVDMCGGCSSFGFTQSQAGVLLLDIWSKNKDIEIEELAVVYDMPEATMRHVLVRMIVYELERRFNVNRFLTEGIAQKQYIEFKTDNGIITLKTEEATSHELKEIYNRYIKMPYEYLEQIVKHKMLGELRVHTSPVTMEMMKGFVSDVRGTGPEVGSRVFLSMLTVYYHIEATDPIENNDKTYRITKEGIEEHERLERKLYKTCPGCGRETTGKYCVHCGQDIGAVTASGVVKKQKGEGGRREV